MPWIVTEFVTLMSDRPDVHENAVLVADNPLMNELSVATKMIPLPQVMRTLKEAGRAAATRFLEEEAHHVGQRSSADLAGLYG